MSEGILKALMRLFALIAFPENDSDSRRTIIKNFLKQQLSHKLVEEYLTLYDDYFESHQNRLQQKNRFRKRFAASSVKVLKIATSINEELTHYQKLIVLVQLFEFLKSGMEISSEEMEFVNTVSQTFNISEEEYFGLSQFIIKPFSTPPLVTNTLIITNKESSPYPTPHYLQWENLDCELRIFNVESAGFYLLRFSSNTEILINGQLLNPDRVHILTPGSSIRNKRINPIYYSDIVSRFTRDKISTPFIFKATDICFKFNKKTHGLQPMSFSSYSGQLVGIMGSSGAGKSTLVNLMSGIIKPYSGDITLNNIDIHKNPDKIEGLIGYVSQDDLLIEEFTVWQNLLFNAKLCFDNYSSDLLSEKMSQLLRSLGLYEIKDYKVGSPLNKVISGGQRKRLNIALELIREPSILFLDEPTSGLSSQDSENILDLLKELALKGKLVYVVIHQPSSDIFKMFNQLIVLDNGGYLIYDGDPVESINFFKSCVQKANRSENECPTCGNVNPEQILSIVNTQVLDEYGQTTQTRKIEAIEWHQSFNKHKTSNTSNHINSSNYKDGILPKIEFKIPNKLKQFFIFITRDTLSKINNKQYLLINLLETPALALLLSSIIRYYDVDETSNQGYIFANNPNLTIYIIIAVIIAIFIGLSVSAEEIINDRKILKREAFLNLSKKSYLFSKLFILMFISAFQSFLFVLIGNNIIDLKGQFLPYWLILFSSSVFANILGLNISDSFKKAVNIYITIPFLIIPQLILSGVFLSYDRLNPQMSSPTGIPWYGEIITARWAFEALAVNQYVNNKYEKEFYIFDKLKSQAKYRKEYWIPALKNKLEYCKKYYKNTESEIFRDASKLILNELLSEPNIPNNKLYNSIITNLKEGEFNDTIYSEISEYLNLLRNFYIGLYNRSADLEDQKIKKLTLTPESEKAFIKLMQNYHNEDLERFVRNSNNFFTNKVIEYKGRLIQKIDPVFKDPKPLLKAHFFAAHKNIFNIKMETLWFNLMVIWLFNLALFILLLFGTFNKLFKYRKKFSLK